MRSRSKTAFIQVEYDEPVAPGDFPGVSTTVQTTVPIQQIVDQYYTPKAPKKQSTELAVLDTMADTVIPGYASKVKAGEILPTNPMTKQSFTRLETAPPLYSIACALLVGPDDPHPLYPHLVYRHVEISTRVLRVPASVLPKNVLTDRDIQAVQVEALAKLRSQGMDMLTTVAELRQTLAMIAGARQRLVKLVQDAIKHLRRGGKRIWSLNGLIDELVSSPWLEARFGWRILYYDLLAIHAYLDTMDEGTKFIVGRSSDRKSLTETIDNITYQYTDEVKVGYPGTLNMSVPGFSSTLNTAWELIPFSLVVDMFFDVQSRILAYSGQSINVSEHQAAAFMTRKRSVVAVAQAEMPSKPNYMATSLHDPSAVIVHGSDEVRSRITAPALGLPSFQLNLGGFKPIDLAFLTRIIISKMF